MRPILILTGIACLAASPALAEKITKDYDQSFPVKSGMRLVLDHGDGDVTVTPWDRDEVRVVVKYRAEVNRIGWGSDMKFEVSFSTSRDEVRVVGHESGFGGVGIFTSDVRIYTYTISAPTYLDLETVGEDGDINVADWQGNLDIRVEDGDVDLARLRSDRVAVRLKDGDLTIRESRGEFDIEMEDGDLELIDVAAEVLRADLEDGDVTADLLGATGMDVEISTGDGRVEIRLPEDASTRYSLRTSDGRLSVEVPDAAIDHHKHQASGTLGEGDGDLRVTTDDGAVTLRLRS